MCVESFSWGVRVMGGWTVGVLISALTSFNYSTKKLHTLYLIQTTITIIHISASSLVFRESGCPCGNQRYSRRLLMMGIVLSETR
jgi:hypothetical protein